MIAHLFNAPIGDDETAVGVGTVGSSEAIMLAGLAFKRKWQNKMKEAGKPYDKPNIVTGANVQAHTMLVSYTAEEQHHWLYASAMSGMNEAEC
jgi:glutamate/tyrosine decarboxylase-like PLP-dependent enzyme